MKELICPNCNKAFKVDDSAYAAIVGQVRSKEFEKELDRRIAELHEQHKVKEQSAVLEAKVEFEKSLAEKDKAISDLNSSNTILKDKIAGFETERNAELDKLAAEKDKELMAAISEKDKMITRLENEIKSRDDSHKLQIIEARQEDKEKLHEKDKELSELRARVEADRLAAENRVNELCNTHRQQLEDKQAEIDRLKDFKLRLSTKMIGETLEQHCATLFAQAQSMGLYPDAEFGKDTKAVEGTKGDFIFRDFIGEDEYISVMFEMKNEADTTATKHRNDDFLEKLDSDRRKKNCEYAVLVSMLELDSDLYNAGIVDKSHRFEKMMVIRPQFFMPVLRLLTEAARKGYNEKRHLITELEVAQRQSLELTNFEQKINKFRDNFNSNLEFARKKFEAANNGIDKAIEGLRKQIKLLEDIKNNFQASEQRLLKADGMVTEDLTIKKLTHGSPNVRKMIQEG